MSDIIKVIKLYLDKVDYKEGVEDEYIEWKLFKSQAIQNTYEPDQRNNA
jgi:hypothetical protein